MADKIILSELVSIIHDKTGVEKAHITATLTGLKETVIESLYKDRTVELGRDFGRFKPRRMAPRRTVLPSGKEVDSPERVTMDFEISGRYRAIPIEDLSI